MKIDSLVTLILGVFLAIVGIVGLVLTRSAGTLIPFVIGASLVYLGWRGGRTALVIFGHACIVVGCMMVTWGIYLLPYSKPTLMHIFARPLFWGMFSIMGGVCAIYHGFCQCILRQK
ncbi:MAG: hypothetical protein MUP41_10280 [Desulfobacterales bacterium]|nr:hypothetical protein [Desulfobacterales bacterium]